MDNLIAIKCPICGHWGRHKIINRQTGVIKCLNCSKYFLKDKQKTGKKTLTYKEVKSKE
jgi:hypothetical protein